MPGNLMHGNLRGRNRGELSQHPTAARTSRASATAAGDRSLRELHTYECHPSAARAPLPGGYAHREPDATLLQRAVREHLASFLSETRESSLHGAGLPRFVELEFAGYLDCGILAHGFSRVRCGDCGHELLVAFSCKGRGVCPSCTARRAHDTAAHLVERVLPRVPVRQWVLTFPMRIRWHLATDPALASAALDLFLRALFAFHRTRARAAGVRDGKPGSVTFVQRFGSALQLNLHLHALLPDGVFVEPAGAAPDAPLCFHALPGPEDAEVEALLLQIATRVVKLLRRRGRSTPSPALKAPSARCRLRRSPPSSRRRRAPPRPPQRVPRGLHSPRQHQPARRGSRRPRAALRLRCPRSAGALPTRRASRRPPLVADEAQGPGGAGLLVLSPLELIAKLAALIPPPRVHLTRFHAVFAPNAAARSRVVPAPPASEAAMDMGLF